MNFSSIERPYEDQRESIDVEKLIQELGSNEKTFNFSRTHAMIGIAKSELPHSTGLQTQLPANTEITLLAGHHRFHAYTKMNPGVPPSSLQWLMLVYAPGAPIMYIAGTHGSAYMLAALLEPANKYLLDFITLEDNVARNPRMYTAGETFIHVYDHVCGGTLPSGNALMPFELCEPFRGHVANILAHHGLAYALHKLFTDFPPLRATFTKAAFGIISKLRCSFSVCLCNYCLRAVLSPSHQFWTAIVGVIHMQWLALKDFLGAAFVMSTASMFPFAKLNKLHIIYNVSSFPDQHAAKDSNLWKDYTASKAVALASDRLPWLREKDIVQHFSTSLVCFSL